MYYLNQFLSQLEVANKLARSRLPQDKRLAVILLDNAIEVDLKKKSRNRFYYDMTTWDSSRTHKSKDRKEVERFFEPLLRFSVANKFITESERAQISFCHTVRNLIYHGGFSEDLLIEATLLILFDLISKKPEMWGVQSQGLTTASYTRMRGKRSIDVPGYENRYFPENIFEIKKHWNAAVRNILNYGLKTKKTSSKLLSLSTIQFLDSLEKNIKSLERGLTYCDINHVFFFDRIAGQMHMENVNHATPQKKLLIVLAYFSCLRKNKDKLADMDNVRQRSQIFAKEFGICIKEKPRYPIAAMKDTRLIARKILKLNTEDALLTYQGIRASFDDLSNAASDACARLSDYEEHTYEQMAGK